HRRLRHRGVTHQGVLERDGADPLATRLDEILRAILHVHGAALVDRDDVAGLEPAVLGEAIAAVVAFEIRPGDPWTARLQPTHRLPVPRHAAVFVAGLQLA